MANPRKGFVIGYAPKLTRATGVSTTGGADVLQTWLKKFAARWGKPGAVEMAATAPEAFAYLLTQHWDCVIFMGVANVLNMYSKYSKVKLPRQIVAALSANGITQRTPVHWFQDPETDQAKKFLAMDVILGLPSVSEYGLATVPLHPAEFESMSRIIVDELTGS